MDVFQKIPNFFCTYFYQKHHLIKFCLTLHGMQSKRNDPIWSSLTDEEHNRILNVEEEKLSMHRNNF